MAYQPSDKSSSSKGYKVFDQQARYFEAHGDFRSPCTIFYEQLVAQLLLWKANKEEIVLCGDFNEHVYNGRLAKRLVQSDLLMQEQCLKATGSHLPATFINGHRPIDAVFATSGIEVLHAYLLPKYGGVGDHRCFILDFTSSSVFGGVFPRVVPARACKLHCDSERICNNYNGVPRQLADRHHMF